MRICLAISLVFQLLVGKFVILLIHKSDQKIDMFLNDIAPLEFPKKLLVALEAISQISMMVEQSLELPSSPLEKKAAIMSITLLGKKWRRMGQSVFRLCSDFSVTGQRDCRVLFHMGGRENSFPHSFYNGFCCFLVAQWYWSCLFCC